jgi:hypothetical protein
LIAALEAAGLNREDAQNVKVKFSCENGSIVYSVGFDANSCIYGFNVDALTGMVMLHDSVIPGVSAESPAGIDQVIDSIDSLINNSTGQNAQINTEHNQTSDSSGNNNSGSGDANMETSDPGAITGDAEDITDTDPEDQPGEISGDVEDIEDDETGDVPGENDGSDKETPKPDSSTELSGENKNTDGNIENKDSKKENNNENNNDSKTDSVNNESEETKANKSDAESGL